MRATERRSPTRHVDVSAPRRAGSEISAPDRRPHTVTLEEVTPSPSVRQLSFSHGRNGPRSGTRMLADGGEPMQQRPPARASADDDADAEVFVYDEDWSGVTGKHYRERRQHRTSKTEHPTSNRTGQRMGFRARRNSIILPLDLTNEGVA